MHSRNILLNTALTSLGIGCSLLLAMLTIEYMIVGNFENILAYSLISITVSGIYLFSMVINKTLLRHQQNDKETRSYPNNPIKKPRRVNYK